MRRRARFSPAAAFIDASRKPVLKTGLVLLLPPLASWPLTGQTGARTPPRLQGETGALGPFPLQAGYLRSGGPGGLAGSGPGWRIRLEKVPPARDAEGTRPHVSPPPL